MLENLNKILEWLFINWLWDFIKIIIWWILWFFSHTLYNKIVVKWDENHITQKWQWNYSRIKWNKNYINQEK